MTRRPARLAVSVGCPSGIGPEVSVRAAADLGTEAKALLVGDLAVCRRAAETTGVAPARLVAVVSAEEGFALPRGKIGVLAPVAPLATADARPGTPSKAGGAAQLAWVDVATDLARAGRADAIVTGPVSKDAIARSGAKGSRGFLGHTEHLARRLGAEEVVMAFHARAVGLTTALVTTHLPLRAVPRAIDEVSVARATYWTAWIARRTGSKRRARPAVVVCALNPHAGENGLLGREEIDVIAGGVAKARARIARARLAVDVTGPAPAESAFRLAQAGTYDAVVAMYHDQATIPMKLLGFGDAVNVSLGLPIVRTSVDHGTAYDRAGKGTADSKGMLEAMRLAVVLARPSRDR